MSQADFPLMSAASRPSARSLPAEDNLNAVAHLADEIRMLRDVLDELREDFSYAFRNPRPVVPSVLKQMAVDPTADDWSERLVIERGECQSVAEESAAEELKQAHEMICTLLGVCELNLDEMEDETRVVIQQAESLLPDSNGAIVSEPEATPADESVASAAARRDQLF